MTNYEELLKHLKNKLLNSAIFRKLNYSYYKNKLIN